MQTSAVSGARVGRTHLASGTPFRRHEILDGEVEIAVVVDDKRAVAADYAISPGACTAHVRSSVSFFSVDEAILAMSLPTRDEPVKLTLRMAGCVQRVSPSSGVVFCEARTTLSTPGGTPARSARMPERSARTSQFRRTKDEAGERRLGRRLHDRGAAGGESGRDLARGEGEGL